LSTVINQPSLLEAAGLGKRGSSLKISIRGKDGLGAKGECFYGSEDLFENDPILMEVTIPNGNWQMAAVPVNGWEIKSPLINSYRMTAMTVVLIILSLLFIQHRDANRRKKAEVKGKKLIKELQNSLAEIKMLSGLLPICASCKKIRDDKGYWNQIEGYIQTHSDAKFSHGMCPECSDKLYGKEDWYIEMKNEEMNCEKKQP